MLNRQFNTMSFYANIMDKEVKYKKTLVEESWERAVRHFGIKPGLAKTITEAGLRDGGTLIDRQAEDGKSSSTYDRTLDRRRFKYRTSEGDRIIIADPEEVVLFTIPAVRKYISNPEKTRESVSFIYKNSECGSSYILFFKMGRLEDFDDDIDWLEIMPISDAIRDLGIRSEARPGQVRAMNSMAVDSDYRKLFIHFMEKLKRE